MSKYSTDPKWQDVVPIEQDDGGPNPLATIVYSDDYAEAMDYLRAVMAANEMSERAVQLTEDIILMNPAHYTVWLYRARMLETLQSNLRHEILWLNAVALGHPKNYQIWHHRQFLIERINDPDGEIELINRMLRLDSKNYHVWSYRQWLVRRFGLWETTQVNGRNERYGDDEDEAEDNEDVAPDLVTADNDDDEAPDLISEDAKDSAQAETTSFPSETTELEETELFILADVRNNSAWNHRFFLISNTPSTVTPSSSDQPPLPAKGTLHPISPTVYDREILFAQTHIRRAPQNQSSWNFLRGLTERYRGHAGADAMQRFCEEFVILPATTAASSNGTGADPDVRGVDGERVTSSHSLHLLAEIWARNGRKRDADWALSVLASRYDPVRANYWEYLRGTLGTKG